VGGWNGLCPAPSSSFCLYLLTRAKVLPKSCGPEYPPCSSIAATSLGGKSYPMGDGSGLWVVVLPTITPSTPDSHTALQMPETCSSESSSGLTFTMIAGFDFRFTPFAASTTPVRMFVRGSTFCRPLSPGVLGLDTLTVIICR